jgi:hypothetical protein
MAVTDSQEMAVTATGRQSVRPRWLGWAALRVAAHLAVWTPFVAGVVEGIRLHWYAVGDGAAIALRSWAELTPHGPLVGQATRLAIGVYDPGPLQYWLEAIPVHLGPRYGVLWGAALWCAVAASIAIEAGWAAAGRLGGLAAAGAVLGLLVWQPQIALKPYWNPWFGAMFFLATLATGWAVLRGRRRWWPVLVIVGSVAAQAHLMFTVASAALIVLGLVAGLADSVRAKAGYWWAALGVLACAGCWSAPIIQQINGRPGNLTLLLEHQGAGKLTGLAFGFKAIAAATRPPPIWWQSQRALNLMGADRVIVNRSPDFAVTVLALTAVALVVAIRPLRSRALAALAALSLLNGAAAVATFATIPVKNTSLRTLEYIDVLAYPVGLLCWATIGATVVLTAYWLVRKLRARPVAVPAALWPVAAAVGGVAVVATVVTASLLAVTRQAKPMDAQPRNLVGVAAQQIERALPRQQVALQVTGTSVANEVPVAMGIAWALRADGYRPEMLSYHAARLLGSGYLYSGQAIPLVKVHVHSTGPSVRVKPASSINR